MINATWWYHAEKNRWNASVNDLPEVNATGGSLDETLDILAEAYTRDTGIPVSADGFALTEIPGA